MYYIKQFFAKTYVVFFFYHSNARNIIELDIFSDKESIYVIFRYKGSKNAYGTRKYNGSSDKIVQLINVQLWINIIIANRQVRRLSSQVYGPLTLTLSQMKCIFIIYTTIRPCRLCTLNVVHSSVTLLS